MGGIEGGATVKLSTNSNRERSEAGKAHNVQKGRRVGDGGRGRERGRRGKVKKKCVSDHVVAE